MSFKSYLQKHGYRASTIGVHRLRIKRFKGWCKAQGYAIDAIGYRELLGYAAHLQKQRSYSRAATNNELRALKLFYDYQMDKAVVVENPAEQLHVRGSHTKVVEASLSEEELEDLYYSYTTEHHDRYFKASKHRDKAALGLLLFQGATPAELRVLQLEHLHIHSGRIELPHTPRGNARKLPLHPAQVAQLMEYLQETREYLLNKIQCHHEEQLFPGSVTQVRGMSVRLVKTLKTHNYKVKSLTQIRTSVLVNWLAKHPLRKVQYMAGHRYISSTEKYLQDDLESLHELINIHHPIR